MSISAFVTDAKFRNHVALANFLSFSSIVFHFHIYNAIYLFWLSSGKYGIQLKVNAIRKGKEVKNVWVETKSIGSRKYASKQHLFAYLLIQSVWPKIWNGNGLPLEMSIEGFFPEKFRQNDGVLNNKCALFALYYTLDWPLIEYKTRWISIQNVPW